MSGDDTPSRPFPRPQFDAALDAVLHEAPARVPDFLFACGDRDDLLPDQIRKIVRAVRARQRRGEDITGGTLAHEIAILSGDDPAAWTAYFGQIAGLSIGESFDRCLSDLRSHVKRMRLVDLGAIAGNGIPDDELDVRFAELAQTWSASAEAAVNLEPLDLGAPMNVEVPIEFGTAGGEVLTAAGDLDIEAGDVGSGKSLAMAFRCVAKVLGKNLFGFPCTSPGRALLVCADGEGPEVIRFRLSRIAAGFGVTLGDLHKAGLQVIVPECLNLDDAGLFASFRKIVDADDPDLIGLDSFNVLIGPDRDRYNAGDVGQFIRQRLRPLQDRGDRPRRSLSVAHHLRKRQGTPGANALKDRVADSYYTVGGVDMAIGLEPSGEEAFIVKMVKRSRWGTAFRPFLVRLEGKGKEPLRAVNTGPLEPTTDEQAADENGILDAMNALAGFGPDGWIAIKDLKRHLAADTKGKEKRIERAAARLAKAGTLEAHATRRGLYRLPPSPRTPQEGD